MDVVLGKRSRLLANVELSVTVCTAVEVHIKYRPMFHGKVLVIVVVICSNR